VEGQKYVRRRICRTQLGGRSAIERYRPEAALLRPLAASASNGLSFSRPARPVTPSTQTYRIPAINIMAAMNRARLLAGALREGALAQTPSSAD
jgi:hypothetical protein